MPRTLDSYIPRAEKVTPLSPQISLYELRFHHELFETPAILSLPDRQIPNGRVLHVGVWLGKWNPHGCIMLRRDPHCLKYRGL